MVDGVDVRDLSFASLRETIGVVSQETYLFHGTVRENLRFARPDATDDEIEQAARAARIHDHLASLPEGYDTVVGERGYRFSGGEKQRLAIARAVLRDPPVLLLDEATSALDVETERAVQDALDRLSEGRTTIVIAHRLSTIRDADMIILLDGGRIAERGTHAELVAAAAATPPWSSATPSSSDVPVAAPRRRLPAERARTPGGDAGLGDRTRARIVAGVLWHDRGIRRSIPTESARWGPSAGRSSCGPASSPRPPTRSSTTWPGCTSTASRTVGPRTRCRARAGARREPRAERPHRQEAAAADATTNLYDMVAFDFCLEEPASGSVPGVAYEVDGEGGITLDPWPLVPAELDGFIVAFLAEGYPTGRRR